MPDNIFWIGNRHTFDVSLARNLSIDSHFKCQFFAYLTHCCKILQNFVWHTDVSFLGKQAPFGWITSHNATKVHKNCYWMSKKLFSLYCRSFKCFTSFFYECIPPTACWWSVWSKKKICGLIETKYVINIWRQKPSEIKWKT